MGVPPLPVIEECAIASRCMATQPGPTQRVRAPDFAPKSCLVIAKDSFTFKGVTSSQPSAIMKIAPTACAADAFAVFDGAGHTFTVAQARVVLVLLSKCRAIRATSPRSVGILLLEQNISNSAFLRLERPETTARSRCQWLLQ